VEPTRHQVHKTGNVAGFIKAAPESLMLDARLSSHCHSQPARRPKWPPAGADCRLHLHEW
ncbi:MAG: hypothetical protein VW891_11955, partial [Novosphingobium sp.]